MYLLHKIGNIKGLNEDEINQIISGFRSGFREATVYFSFGLVPLLHSVPQRQRKDGIPHTQTSTKKRTPTWK